jgi:hypothetical protein
MFRPRSRSSGSYTPNSSPNLSSQKKRHRLSMAGIASLFINIRRFEDKAISTNELELSSGDPKTHPNVAEGARDQNKIPVEQTDLFVCAGGVNLTTLLRITRISLMERAERALGANSMVDEQCVYFNVGPLGPLFIHCPFFFLLSSDGSVLFRDQNLCRVESTRFRYGLCSQLTYTVCS